MNERKYSLQNPEYLNGKNEAIIDFYGEEWAEEIKIHINNAVFEMQDFLYEAAGGIPIVIDYDDNYEIALNHPLDGPAQKLIEELFVMRARQLYDEICEIEEEQYSRCKKEFDDNESAERTIKNYLENKNAKQAAIELLMSNDKGRFIALMVEGIRGELEKDNSVPMETILESLNGSITDIIIEYFNYLAGKR